MARGVSSSAREAGDDGSAVVEFVALSLLLLVPLVYLVVTLAHIQAGAFAAEAAAHDAARAVVVEGVDRRESGASVASAMASGSARAQAATAIIAEDFGFDAEDASLQLSCDSTCLDPGGNVTASVEVAVPLPGVPDLFGGAFPLEVTVSASARAAVDSLTEDR